MKTLTLTLTYALLDSIPPIYPSSLTSFAHNCPGSRIANFTIKKKRANGESVGAVAQPTRTAQPGGCMKDATLTPKTTY